MCDPIEGTDRCRLAECLGLDPSRFKNIVASGSDSQRIFNTLDSQIPDTERFAGVSPFLVRCRHCTEKFEFKGAQGDTVSLKCYLTVIWQTFDNFPSYCADRHDNTQRLELSKFGVPETAWRPLCCDPVGNPNPRVYWQVLRGLVNLRRCSVQKSNTHDVGLWAKMFKYKHGVQRPDELRS
jgi:hypothetical protein